MRPSFTVIRFELNPDSFSEVRDTVQKLQACCLVFHIFPHTFVMGRLLHDSCQVFNCEIQWASLFMGA